jgi:hypothetical protein
MGALTLEVGRTRTSRCGHCGEMLMWTSGFVYSDGNAHAVYHAALHPDPKEPDMDLAIGMGESWDLDVATADTSAFMRVWPSEADIKIRFVDPAESVWSSAKLLANQLSAAEARDSTARSELLRIAELITNQDSAVDHHLRHGAPSGNAT